MIRTLRAIGKHTAVTILILSAFYHSVVSVKNSMLDYVRRTSPDPVSVSDDRFKSLRFQIASERYGKIGYLTNIPEGMDWSGEYLRTQYALAPIVVDDSPNAGLVVANFKEPYSIGDTIRDTNVIAITNFGNGVLLIRRRTH